MSAIKVAKAAFRKEIENKLGLLTKNDTQSQTEVVVQKLFNLAQFKESKRISIFLSLDTEVNTEPIVRKIFEDGKQCFVPRYNKSEMEMVKLHSMDDWQTLPVTKWNIKQPPLKDARENALDAGLDLIIVPGVAFTKDGLRLGHGAGYYDKYLKKVKEAQDVAPFTVGVAFKEQIVDELPIEPTDVQIDMVLYPN